MSDTTEMALNCCARAHALAAVAWLNADYNDRPARDAANEVNIARRCSERALEVHATIEPLPPEELLAIRAHCRDAECIAAVDWHLADIARMVGMLAHWKETHQ